MTREVLKRLTGLDEAAALALLSGLSGGETLHQPGAFLWKPLHDGSVIEVQLGLDGVVSVAGVVPADRAQERESWARRCHPTPQVLQRLRRVHTGQLAEELVDSVVGAQRKGLAHLGTRLGPDGAQARSYALPGGGVVELLVAADGTWRQLGLLSGYAGYGRVRAALESSWRLPEKHRVYPTVRTWGEAFAHARSMGDAVVSVREHYDDNPRVVLLCEQPTAVTSEWYPRFADDGPEPTMERARFTRTYRIQDRRLLHVAWMGTGPSALKAGQWALLATVVGRGAPGQPPSIHQLQVARAALQQLLALIPEGADALPVDASSRVEQAVRKRFPDLFTRVGLLARLESVQVRPPLPGLQEGLRQQLLDRLTSSRPVLEALQDAAKDAPIVLNELARQTSSRGGSAIHLVVTEVGPSPVQALLTVVLDSQERIRGVRLLEGLEARAEHARLAAAQGPPEESARKAALSSAALLSEQLQAVLQAVVAEPSLLQHLRPRPGDARLAFTEEVAEAIERDTLALWEAEGERLLAPRAGQTEIAVSVAPAGAFGTPGPLTSSFPRAYHGMAPWLVSGRVWATWVHRVPGQSRGMRYDGLVWLDDHWAWFPKPWRALRERGA